MDEGLKEILEIVTDMQDRMATKDDLKRFATKEDLNEFRNDLQVQITDLQVQATAITTAVDNLTEEVRDTKGYAKEIDLLMSDVSMLKKEVFK